MRRIISDGLNTMMEGIFTGSLVKERTVVINPDKQGRNNNKEVKRQVRKKHLSRNEVK